MDVSRIVDMCWDHRITVAELERNAGLGNGVIGKWKTCTPRLDSLEKIATYFKCSVSDLLVETDAKGS